MIVTRSSSTGTDPGTEIAAARKRMGELKAGATTVRDDVVRDIHDLNAKERARTFDRWVELSKLVAPPQAGERENDAASPDRQGEPERA